MKIILLGNNVEVDEMGKKTATIFIRGGANVGDKRTITNRATGESFIGTIIKDLVNTMQEVTTFNGKKMMPAKDYYRVELDE